VSLTNGKSERSKDGIPVGIIKMYFIIELITQDILYSINLSIQNHGLVSGKYEAQIQLLFIDLYLKTISPDTYRKMLDNEFSAHQNYCLTFSYRKSHSYG